MVRRGGTVAQTSDRFAAIWATTLTGWYWPTAAVPHLRRKLPLEMRAANGGLRVSLRTHTFGQERAYREIAESGQSCFAARVCLNVHQLDESTTQAQSHQCMTCCLAVAYKFAKIQTSELPHTVISAKRVVALNVERS